MNIKGLNIKADVVVERTPVVCNGSVKGNLPSRHIAINVQFRLERSS